MPLPRMVIIFANFQNFGNSSVFVFLWSKVQDLNSFIVAKLAANLRTEKRNCLPGLPKSSEGMTKSSWWPINLGEKVFNYKEGQLFL